MRLKFLAILALVAAPLFADTNLFSKYETIRLAFLKNSINGVHAGAKDLAAAATESKNDAVAKAADAVATAKNLDLAREAFGTLSDEMIKLRKETKGDRPGVAYCPMAKKSWLQPKGDIGNPYEPAMTTCGMWKDQD